MNLLRKRRGYIMCESQKLNMKLSFTTLMMSATGGMGRECQKFYLHSTEMISSKKGTGYNITVARIRRQITFLLIKSSNNMLYIVRTWYLHTLRLKIQSRFKIKNAN